MWGALLYGGDKRGQFFPYTDENIELLALGLLASLQQQLPTGDPQAPLCPADLYGIGSQCIPNCIGNQVCAQHAIGKTLW